MVRDGTLGHLVNSEEATVYPSAPFLTVLALRRALREIHVQPSPIKEATSDEHKPCEPEEVIKHASPAWPSAESTRAGPESDWEEEYSLEHLQGWRRLEFAPNLGNPVATDPIVPGAAETAMVVQYLRRPSRSQLWTALKAELNTQTGIWESRAIARASMRALETGGHDGSPIALTDAETKLSERIQAALARPPEERKLACKDLIEARRLTKEQSFDALLSNRMEDLIGSALHVEEVHQNRIRLADILEGGGLARNNGTDALEILMVDCEVDDPKVEYCSRRLVGLPLIRYE